jgi:sigma-E factor negative regulatory protein RseB
MRRWLLFAGVACSSQTVQAAQPAPSDAPIDAGTLLVQAAEASRTSNYQGVVIYRGDERFEVLRVQHRYKDDSERERMVSLTGDPRQLLRIDNRLISITPKGRAFSSEGPSLKGFLAQLTLERVEQLKAHYEFRSEGEGRIAGRPCHGVVIRPRDKYRYGYEVWTDQETRLPLKISLTGSRSEVLEQVMFTEVAFPKSIPDEAFETEVDTRKFTLVTRNLPTLDDAAAIEQHIDPQVALGKLPPGFKVVMHDDRVLPDGSGNVEHLLLSDGLSSVSVFSTVRSQEAKGVSGASHIGAVQAYGTVVGSFHVTIVGEVPGAAIKMIGDNLRVPLPGPGGASAARNPSADAGRTQAITAPANPAQPH